MILRCPHQYLKEGDFLRLPPASALLRIEVCSFVSIEATEIDGDWIIEKRMHSQEFLEYTSYVCRLHTLLVYSPPDREGYSAVGGGRAHEGDDLVVGGVQDG